MKHLLKTAIEKHQAGEIEQAEEIYHLLLEENPDDTDILHLLAILSGQKQSFQKALSYVIKAIRLEPSNPSLYNNLGNIYKNLKNTGKAIDAYHKAITLNPQNAVALNNLGSLLHQEGKLDEAISNYKAAIKFKPDYTDALYNLGLILKKQNKINEASYYFKKTLSIDPNHFESITELGKTAHQKKDYPQAIQHYQDSLKLSPEQIDTQNNLGAIFLVQSEYKKAISAFQTALSHNPKHIESLNNLANAYLETNQINDALKYYLRSLEIESDENTLYNVGVIYMNKDHHDNAIRYFKQTLDANPKHLNSFINLATVYFKKEMHTEAIKYYKAALNISPDDQEILYILSALQQSNEFDTSPKEYITSLFDQYAPYFDTHLTDYLNYKSPQLLFKTVSTHLGCEKSNLSILDLGCGTGLCGKIFRPLAKKLTGIDLSKKMIGIAEQKNCYDALKVASIETYLNSNNQLFDLILAADVFTYIGDLENMFKSCRKNLFLNGLFAFTTEKTNEENYILQTSARFAHHKKYIETLAEKNHFNLISCDNTILRTQKKQPLEGYLWLLAKK